MWGSWSVLFNGIEWKIVKCISHRKDKYCFEKLLFQLSVYTHVLKCNMGIMVRKVKHWFRRRSEAMILFKHLASQLDFIRPGP